jgi:hypothetical protein
MKITARALGLLMLLLVVTAMPAWAGQGAGSSPYTADLLVSGLNTGQLNPGQEYWYAFSRVDLGDLEYDAVTLNLAFEAEGRAIANRVNFQVFNFEQVDAWLKDNSGPIDSLGLGTPVSADFDAITGERLWSGAMLPDEVYYVRVFNLSPSPVRYRLTALGQTINPVSSFLEVNPTGLGVAQAIPASMSTNTRPDSLTPTEPTLPFTPPTALPVTLPPTMPTPPETGATAPTPWLLAAQAIQGLPPQEAAAWLMSAVKMGWLSMDGASPALTPFNPNTDQSAVTTPGGEGQAGGSGAGREIPAPPIPITLVQGESVYPNQAFRLFDGANTGRLAPRAEHWYTFTPGKVDGKLIENMSLTMFFTPGEPNLARHVTFELFTGSQYQIWERGTPNDMEHFGAGSWVSRDNDYQTGERLWHGTVVDGDQYFVKITNGTNQWVDYHLVTDDIINTELGPKTNLVRPEPVSNTPTGKDIGAPLTASLGHNRGHLSAGEDIWLTFENRNINPDKFEFKNYLMELHHTPGIGNVANYVNVEIYPYQEQQIWRRGDTDKIIPLGAGSDLEYDKASDTHTWAWNGHLVSNTIYFVRVRNDSGQDIEYDLVIQRR